MNGGRKDKEFTDCIKEYVKYWENQDATLNEKLNGLAFSILVALDGLSESFSGSIDDIGNDMLHEIYCEEEINEQ